MESNTIRTVPRRVITGMKDGKSVIERDEIVTNVSEEYPGMVMSDVWCTGSMPVNLNEEKVIPNIALPHTPDNGTYFRYVSIPPDKSMGIEHVVGQPHPLMHQTTTLDYIIILSGEMYLIMEEGETLLKTGDIVIQRGTNHAWSNRTEEPCIQLAVLIDAREV